MLQSIGMVLVLSSLALTQPKAIVDWDKAYREAKAGNTVTLNLNEVTSSDADATVDVYLKDGRKQNLVGSFAFHVNKTMNTTMDMTDCLAKLRKAPSDKSVIYLKTDAKSIELKSFDIKYDRK